MSTILPWVQLGSCTVECACIIIRRMPFRLWDKTEAARWRFELQFQAAWVGDPNTEYTSGCRCEIAATGSPSFPRRYEGIEERRRKYIFDAYQLADSDHSCRILAELIQVWNCGESDVHQDLAGLWHVAEVHATEYANQQYGEAMVPPIAANPQLSPGWPADESNTP